MMHPCFAACRFRHFRSYSIPQSWGYAVPPKTANNCLRPPPLTLPGRNRDVLSYPSISHWSGDAREAALTPDVVRYILFNYAVACLEEVGKPDSGNRAARKETG